MIPIWPRFLRLYSTVCHSQISRALGTVLGLDFINEKLGKSFEDTLSSLGNAYT